MRQSRHTGKGSRGLGVPPGKGGLPLSGEGYLGLPRVAQAHPLEGLAFAGLGPLPVGLG